MEKAFSSQKRPANTLKHELLQIIVYFCGSFLPSWIRIRIRIPIPDPQTRLNTDPIRIRIHNPGFFTPRRRSQPRHRSARPQPPSAVQIRPLGLRPRGLGGALWRLITASYRTVPPHAISPHAHGGPHTCEILVISKPT